MKSTCLILQEQKQILSQRQVESLRILAMDAQELREFMIQEQDENPLLNFIENRSSRARVHAGMSGMRGEIQNIPAPVEETVQDFLLTQLRLNDHTPEEYEVLQTLAGAVDERGFLVGTPEELSEIFRIPQPLLHKCLRVLQNLDPPGVCCFSLEECLLKQLEVKGERDEILLRIVQFHLGDVAKRRLGHLARTLEVDIAHISHAVATLMSLTPNPLNGLIGRTAQYAIPDLLLSWENGGWEIELNNDWFGKFERCDYYEQLAQNTSDEELRDYLQEKAQRVRFLNMALEKRRNTLLRIGHSLAAHHSDYFLRGDSLAALTMTDLADELQMHSSTISRAIKNKYLQHPRGVCEIRSLFVKGTPYEGFCSKISREAIKTRIYQLVAEEDKSKPCSDAQLKQLLMKQGIQISRRTVSKYREELALRGMHDRQRRSRREQGGDIPGPGTREYLFRV